MSGGVRRLSAETGGEDGTGTGGGPSELSPAQQPREPPLCRSEQHRNKVYLKPRLRTPDSVRMLTDEASQIQEVRYCLKTLREQMAARQTNNNNNNKFPANGVRVTSHDAPPISHDASVGDDHQESVKLREASRRLHARLKEAERRHQEEMEQLQAETNRLRALLAERSERLQRAEQESKEKEEQVKELQSLLQSAAEETSRLKEQAAEKEAELLTLKTSEEEEQRSAQLQKEASALKEKNHLLDDMLKSHQRKVRSMIEQVQNSKTMLQDRDQVIRDLEERLAFLDAENRELRDHMDFYLNGQQPPPLPPAPAENKPEIVYSKPLTPTAHSSKPLPFIKVIEIKS